MTADDAHHQAAASAGVAEVERLPRGQDRADADPLNSPCARPAPVDDRAERLASLTGSHDVVALEQPFDRRQATREKAEQKGAMRDRLIARRPDPPLERPRAFGAERRSGGRRRENGHGRNGLGFSRREPRRRKGPRSYHRRWKLSTAEPYGPLTKAPGRQQRSPPKFRPQPPGIDRLGQTRTRKQASVPELRRQILRSQQGSGRLPEMRDRVSGRGAGAGARKA